MGYENQTGPKRNLGIEPNLEPIPYNPPDVLDDDAYPISQTWTDIKKKKKKNQMQLKNTSSVAIQAQLCKINIEN